MNLTRLASRGLTTAFFAVSLVTLGACSSGATELIDASAPGCPASPSTLSGACGTIGQVCVYRSGGCPEFRYECQADDGGTSGTWIPLLCD